MKYLSITQTAERWGISTRRIQILCAEGRVPGAIRIGTVWGIPDDEPKPADARIKSGKYVKKPTDNNEWATELSATLTRNNGVHSTPRVRMGALRPWFTTRPKSSRRVKRGAKNLGDGQNHWYSKGFDRFRPFSTGLVDQGCSCNNRGKTALIFFQALFFPLS